VSDFQTDIAALTAAIPGLPEGQRDFARNLIRQAMDPKARGLSDKQWFWVKKLAAPKVQVKTVDLTALHDFFDAADGKFPSMVYRTEAGTKLRLSKAGPASKYPKSLNVTDTSKKFAERVWFGRIGLDGGFTPAARLDQPTVTAIVAALEAFAANPTQAAAQYGFDTGECCFCAAELTDPKSKAVGYGPVCAKKWHLPWGAKA
jgi:Family of unknown function (DUF6011)